MKQKQSGFTLVEVTFAILILAGALVTLLGLQSSSIQRNLRDKNSQLAMLVARQILTAIELDTYPLQDGFEEDTAAAVLSKIDGNTLDAYEFEQLAPLRVAIDTSPAGIPDIGDDILQKITLNIFWGEGRQDRLLLNYFVPNEETIRIDN